MSGIGDFFQAGFLPFGERPLSAQSGPATVQGDWALTCDALVKAWPAATGGI